MTKLGRQLRAWRKRSGLFQTVVAKRLRIGQPHLSQIETGKATAGPELAARIERMCGS